MRKSDFYETMTPQSHLKIQIVTKYFDAWSKVMLTKGRRSEIGYVDLFSGPGRYRGGEDSTPLLILKRAVQDPRLRSGLRTLFNDSKPDFVSALRERIAEVPEIDRLSFQPRVMNETVGNDLIRRLDDFGGIPTLYFVDPWGYKGVTAEILKHTVIGQGSECILFFNFNRVNSAVSNQTVEHHIQAMFGGEDGLSLLREVVAHNSRRDREELIVQFLSNVLKESGAEYHIFFRFEHEASERTSHYIVFASKHFLGLKIMRDIMARESMGFEGLPVFEWKPQRSPQLSLDLGFQKDEIDRNIIEMVSRYYSKREATVGEVFQTLSVGTTYTLADFQRVINSLEESGRVIIDKSREKRMVGGKLTLGENRRVRFLE